MSSNAETAAGSAAPVSWRDRLARGELEGALSAYVRFGPEEPGVRETLEDLHSVLSFVKAKAFGRAERLLDGIEERADWFDWEEFTSSFAAVRQAVSALDEREPEQVEQHLTGADHPFFVAEKANIRGTALIFAGEFEQARAFFEQALEVDPGHYRALTNLGNAALESGDPDGAIEYYQQAITLNADFPNAHHNLGVAWRKKGKIGKSIASLKAGQKAQQRFEQAEAREQLGSMTRRFRGGTAGKYLKWLLWGALAAGAYWFLVSRGSI
ncbi:MAG TPA: tetratricopeptide repeat protein [Deinococcales bacterium]|nr:tetratricopeptide repeat protein [Deinococcales bacterium]